MSGEGGPPMRRHVWEGLQRDGEGGGLNECIVFASAEPYALAIPGWRVEQSTVKISSTKANEDVARVVEAGQQA
jgi:hypothetical protein